MSVMSSAVEDGVLNSEHLEGDPVRDHEPAITPRPTAQEGEQTDIVPVQPTIVRGQD